MKNLPVLLAATLIATATAAQAVPVNENNLNDFRAYANKSCLKKQNDAAFCNCTDQKVETSFRAASWETGGMSSAADKTQFLALHSAAMNQCTFEIESGAFAMEQADMCQQNAGQIPTLARLDAAARASACGCIGQKISDAAFGTDSTKPVEFNKNVDVRAILTAALPACTSGN